jgi:hypothetical protein
MPTLVGMDETVHASTIGPGDGKEQKEKHPAVRRHLEAGSHLNNAEPNQLPSAQDVVVARVSSNVLNPHHHLRRSSPASTRGRGREQLRHHLP